MLDLDPPDLSEKTQLVDHLSAVGLTPSATIWSGRGWHVLYYFDTPTPADEVSRAVARRLCSYTRSDPVHAPMQLGRLPCSINWRDADRPVRCQLVANDPSRRYSLELVSRALDAVGAPTVPVRSTPRPGARSAARPRSVSTSTSTSSPRSTAVPLPPLPADLRLHLREHIERGTQRGSRSEADISLVRALLVGGWSEDHIVALFDGHPTTCGAKTTESGPDYLRRTIERATDHLGDLGASAVTAVVEKIGAVHTSVDFTLVVDVRLLDGSNALARGRASISHTARWVALWEACGLAVPTSQKEARSLYRQIVGRRLRVAVVQRKNTLVAARMFPLRDL